jgi:uncharacterized protein YbjT (DUF2867 family)
MRVFVAGATGEIGQYLVPSLVAAGHEVTGTTRSPSKGSQLGWTPRYPGWRHGFPVWTKEAHDHAA